MARLYKCSADDWQYDFSGYRTMALGKQRNIATQLRDGKYSLPLWPVRRSLGVAHHQRSPGRRAMDDDGRTAPGVRGHVPVSLSHSVNIATRIGL